MCVAGIPSMHLCLDFLLELLQQPNASQRAFGILLAGSLIDQYPLPTSLPIAHQVCTQSPISLHVKSLLLF